MKIRTTPLDGVKLIDSLQRQDDRGLFVKTFSKDDFERAGLASTFSESYYSQSRTNVIRGMHFQSPPAECAKLVSVARGTILDVVLDIRARSRTYGAVFMVSLSADKRQSLYIPPGFAHGFAALKDDTIVSYLQSSVHAPELDHGIHPLSCGIDWGIPHPVLSPRDAALPPLSDFRTPFI